ncbi:MAG TPA: biotin--[acetyl-CoA-carboxylase] ligase [Candidatus Enterenecus stercoripullorum]|nr:biotin--[acetyl-CoA-carboxylase] ligase [Candidatus Enterenecus stercoripullorum]
MDQNCVLALLAGGSGWLSGEEMSRALGVTRAAVWKQITQLRQAGWPIESSTRLGYRLSGPPPCLSASYLNALLPPDGLFSGKIQTIASVDSTNTRLKALAAAGAPEGTVLLAEEQTAGRGTRGRSFSSPRGQGLYLSVLLRPKVSLEELLTLTGWAAVAFRDGIQAACGAGVGIKWLNDLYLGNGKLCGILTELSLLGESGEPDYVVIGAGINLTQNQSDFQAQGLDGIATSLALEGFTPERHHLAACVLTALGDMVRAFPARQEDYLARYRAHCITLGRQVSFQENGQTLVAAALDVSDHFALVVGYPDGTRRTLSSGSIAML